MEHTNSLERGIVLPNFSGNKLTILKQLSELAAQRVPNEAWYAIEWLGNDAARVVSDLLNAHMYYEEGVRSSGGEPVKFIDFVSTKLEALIADEQSPEKVSDEEVHGVEPEASFAQSVQTADEVNKMIRAALGRQRINRRQYSNTHFRSRR